MKTIKEQAHDLTKALVDQMIEKDSRGWPPGCLLFAYQPERPQNAIPTNEEELDKNL